MNLQKKEDKLLKQIRKILEPKLTIVELATVSQLIADLVEVNIEMEERCNR